MPLYDRKCEKCDEIFEVNCKISEKDDPKECPYCGATEGTYMMSAPMSSIRPERFSANVKNNKGKGFSEVLSKISERNKRTPLAREYK